MDVIPDSLPVNELSPKGHSAVNRFRFQWHWVLLSVLVGLMIWMSASLLWSQPTTKIVLTPLSPAELVVTLPQAVLDTETDADGANSTESETVSSASPKKKPKGRKHAVTRKKPIHPPVLNLNTASFSQFQLLPGIGPKMAQRIVEYRKAHGPFQNPGQLTEVKGIGPKKLEKLKPFLKV
jgi:competence ComEA-like helix-hairpin-helix protein